MVTKLFSVRRIGKGHFVFPRLSISLQRASIRELNEQQVIIGKIDNHPHATFYFIVTMVTRASLV
jgi:hypothetical protein